MVLPKKTPNIFWENLKNFLKNLLETNINLKLSHLLSICLAITVALTLSLNLSLLNNLFSNFLNNNSISFIGQQNHTTSINQANRTLIDNSINEFANSITIIKQSLKNLGYYFNDKDTVNIYNNPTNDEILKIDDQSITKYVGDNVVSIINQEIVEIQNQVKQLDKNQYDLKIEIDKFYRKQNKEPSPYLNVPIPSNPPDSPPQSADFIPSKQPTSFENIPQDYWRKDSDKFKAPPSPAVPEPSNVIGTLLVISSVIFTSKRFRRKLSKRHFKK